MIRIERIQSTGTFPTKTSDRIKAETEGTFESDAVEFDQERTPEKEPQGQQSQQHEENLPGSGEQPASPQEAKGARALNVVA